MKLFKQRICLEEEEEGSSSQSDENITKPRLNKDLNQHRNNIHSQGPGVNQTRPRQEVPFQTSAHDCRLPGLHLHPPWRRGAACVCPQATNTSHQRLRCPRRDPKITRMVIFVDKLSN